MENSSSINFMRWQQFLTIIKPYNFDDAPSLTLSKANSTLAGKSASKGGPAKSDREITESEIYGCAEILKDISKSDRGISTTIYRGRLDD